MKHNKQQTNTGMLAIKNLKERLLHNWVSGLQRLQIMSSLLIQRYSIAQFVQSIDLNELKSWLIYARQYDIVRCAIKMAVIVGTILMLINHGEELWLDQLTTLDWIQIGLTYLVPYSVSTYSSVELFRRHHEQQ